MLDTQGPCSHGDAREVDADSVLARGRRTWEATGGGRGLGHAPLLTAAARTKAVAA